MLVVQRGKYYELSKMTLANILDQQFTH